MIKCTVKLKTGEKITFEAPTWLDALAHYTAEYHNRAKKVKFEEDENHVQADDTDCL